MVGEKGDLHLIPHMLEFSRVPRMEAVGERSITSDQADSLSPVPR